jgi:hypothetical protein
MEFILAQTGLWGDYSYFIRDGKLVGFAVRLASVTCFLGTFAGDRSPRNERSRFSYKLDFYAMPARPPRYNLQVHFRCYTCPESLHESLMEGVGTGGLLCKRQRGRIASTALGVDPRIFEERRISIFGILSRNPVYNKKTLPAFYRVLVLADAGIDLPFEQITHSGLLEGREGLEGTLAFYAAVLVTVGVWETEWNNVLDQIDNCLRMGLDDTLYRE